MSENIVDASSLHAIEKTISANAGRGKKHIYLFLDFDGVINLFIDTDRDDAVEIMRKRAETMEFADRECVRNLDQLLSDHPEIDVIISSSWRLKGVEYCRQYLKKAGLNRVSQITDVIEHKEELHRSQEIANYLLQHPDYTDYMIFDDQSMSVFGDRWVYTHPYHGYDAERDAWVRQNLLHERHAIDGKTVLSS